MTQDWPPDEGKWRDDRQKAQLSLSIRVNKRKVVEQRKKRRIFFNRKLYPSLVFESLYMAHGTGVASLRGSARLNL